MTLTYSGTTLTEEVDESFGGKIVTFTGVDYQSLLGGSTGYVGFTGTTAALARKIA